MMEAVRVELAGRQPLSRRDVRVCAADEEWLVLDARRLLFASPLDLAAIVAMAHSAAAERMKVAFVIPADVNVAAYLQRMGLVRRFPAGTEIVGSLPGEQRTDRAQSQMDRGRGPAPSGLRAERAAGHAGTGRPTFGKPPAVAASDVYHSAVTTGS